MPTAPAGTAVRGDVAARRRDAFGQAAEIRETRHESDHVDEIVSRCVDADHFVGGERVALSDVVEIGPNSPP